MSENRLSLGIITVSISVLLFSTAELFVKLLGQGFPLHQIVLFRSLFALIPVYFVWRRQPGIPLFKTTAVKDHVWRVFFGITSMFAVYWAIILLPLGIAATLTSMAPLFVAILAPFILGERVGTVLFFASVLCFIGVIIVIRPNEVFSISAGFVGIGAAILSAFVMLFLRRLGRTEPAVRSTVFNALATLVAAVLLVPILGWKSPTGMEYLLFVLMGCSGGLAQIINAYAYKCSDVAIIANLEYFAVVWGVLFGILFWSETYDLLTCLGIGIIVAGCLISTQSKRIL